MINADSFDEDDKWVKRWEKVVRLRGKLYFLPGGAIGRKVVSVFAEEIKRFGNGEQKSEKHICFLPLMLNMVKDIKKNNGHQKASIKKNSTVG